MHVVENQKCYEHITFDSNGAPIIVGTNTKVTELIVERLAYGWSPEELHFQHQYLSLGQIYAALAYYADHSDELDKDIERRLHKIEKLQQKASPSPIMKKLKARKKVK